MKRKTFKPGQLVLTQYWHGDDKEHMKWKLQIYSHYDNELKNHLMATDLHGYSDDTIIPYKGNEDKLGKEVKDKNDGYAPPPDNQPEYSCIYCGDKAICTNTKCVMHNLRCDGAKGCNGYRSFISEWRSERRFKKKKWHKVKTMFDTYLPNARYY